MWKLKKDKASLENKIDLVLVTPKKERTCLSIFKWAVNLFTKCQQHICPIMNDVTAKTCLLRHRAVIDLKIPTFLATHCK